MELRLTISVKYNPNGVPEEDLKKMLVDGAKHLFEIGAITLDTEAEVDQWVFRVETVTK